MIYNGSDKHKIALFEKKQDKLTAGDNITLTPQQDGTVRIDAEGGGVDSLADLSDVALSTPSNGEVLKYNSSTDKWENGEAGGNVADVMVNGVSVVDLNKVAQVKAHKEITQAQYDALPASKLTDNILYCIKDSGIVEGNQFAPVIYSLEEREVGTWTDGKPLYEKTIVQNNINVGYYTQNPQVQTQIAHGVSNIGEIVSLRITCPKLGIAAGDTLFAGTNGYTLATFRVDDTNIEARAGENFYAAAADRYWYFTIRYTKTTDVPGSGSWGTDGVPMVHYDDTERIVGTWFGETLYERTIYYDNASGITETSQYDYEIASISNIIIRNCFGTMIDDTNGASYGIPYSVGSKGITIVYKSNSSLCLRAVGDTWSNNWKFYITIQYTKS